MSSDIMSESICIDEMESPSKSVTKVQRLPNVGSWNDSNAILRDYIKSFFSKRSSVFRMKKQMTTRKRVIILTPNDILLVYETNCTGYSFDIHEAMRMKTSCYGFSADSIEKSCTITLKYKFGYVNLVLMNDQISVWRRTVSTVFEGECFDRSLVTDLTLYTARDDDLDDSFFSKRSNFEYTESAISLKSAQGCINLSPSQYDLTVEETQNENLSTRTNSNRSSTCLPLTIRSNVSNASIISIRQDPKPLNNNNNQNPISIRHGTHCVSYLAKKFESKLGIGRKTEKNVVVEEKLNRTSSPLEILFPSLPIQQLQEEEELKSLNGEKNRNMSKLDFTSPKKSIKRPIEIKIED